MPKFVRLERRTWYVSPLRNFVPRECELLPITLQLFPEEGKITRHGRTIELRGIVFVTPTSGMSLLHREAGVDGDSMKRCIAYQSLSLRIYRPVRGYVPSDARLSLRVMRAIITRDASDAEIECRISAHSL